MHLPAQASQRQLARRAPRAEGLLENGWAWG